MDYNGVTLANTNMQAFSFKFSYPKSQIDKSPAAHCVLTVGTSKHAHPLVICSQLPEQSSITSHMEQIAAHLYKEVRKGSSELDAKVCTMLAEFWTTTPKTLRDLYGKGKVTWLEHCGPDSRIPYDNFREVVFDCAAHPLWLHLLDAKQAMQNW